MSYEDGLKMQKEMNEAMAKDPLMKRNCNDELKVETRRDWVLLEEFREPTKQGNIYIPPSSNKKARWLTKMRIICKSPVESTYIKDLVVGDLVLVNEDDLLYYSTFGKLYAICEEQWVVARVRD